MKYLSYGSQLIDKSDINEVIKTLTSDYLTQGPKIQEFERKLSAYSGARYTVAVNSGTAALHTAYFALGLSKGDEIITTPMTFAATSNAALYLGAKPIFVDIDPTTGLIDPKLIESKINSKTKIISVVDYGGQPTDFDAIKKIARKHQLKIVDDACHALGATYHGRILGNGLQADTTIFSFHPVKHITTGEGGAIQTNDKQVYERALQFRTHGITKEKIKLKNRDEGEWYYEMQELGFNYRLSDVLATLGISQLRKIDSFLLKRRKIAVKYDVAFKNNPFFDVPPHIEGTQNAYHLYPIRLRDEMLPLKSDLVKKLKQKGIGTQVHYIPVYRHPYYQKLGYKKSICPNAETFYERVLSIPMYPKLTTTDANRVIKTILSTCEECIK